MALYSYNPELRIDVADTVTKGRHQLQLYQLLAIELYNSRNLEIGSKKSYFKARNNRPNTTTRGISLGCLNTRT